MRLIKKQNFFGWTVFAASILSLVGMIVYLVTSTTGYLQGTAMNVWPIVLNLIVTVISLAAVIFSDKIDRRITGAVLVVLSVLLAISFCQFIDARVDLFADIYFIPVNYPLAEKAALNASIVGFVFYVLAFVALVIGAFGEKLFKEQA